MAQRLSDSHLRVLAIAPTSFFADYGCHVRIRGQMAAMAARGHTVRILTYPNGRDVDNLATIRPPIWPRGRKIAVGSSRRKLVLDALLASLGPTALLRFPGGPPHLIHAYLHEGALLGTLLSRYLRTPLVFDFQGSLTEEMLDHRFLHPRSPFLSPLRQLEAWIDRQPHAVLASSAHAANLLMTRFAVQPQRVVSLPDSVDPTVFRPRHELPSGALAALQRRLQLPLDRPILIYLGLLAPYQGTDLLLRAVQHLVQQARRPAPSTRPTMQEGTPGEGTPARPPYSLIMGFPHLDRYRQLATEMGLSHHIRFTGPVPYEEAPLYLALGDVAVAPKLSATEGSGKLLPYMAAGLPVIAFDTPVHREYLGHWGHYAPAGDAVGLAAAIQRVLAAPAESGCRGLYLRARVVQHYTWHHAAEQIEAIYRSLLAANPHP
jgi:glycosyltransferase involved in cell wall biosynthesis